MNQSRKKILWLVNWYPNKWDAFDGDFIQRHAKAAALHHDIHVLFVKMHEQQNGIGKEGSDDNELTEQIIYLPKRTGLLGKLQNHRQWKVHYQGQISLIVQRYQPDFIHVHVPWKVGLMALWAKKKFGLPHFAGYFFVINLATKTNQTVQSKIIGH